MDQVHVKISELLQEYSFLIGDEVVNTHDFLNRIVQYDPDMEYTCRYLSRFIDD